MGMGGICIIIQDMWESVYTWIWLAVLPRSDGRCRSGIVETDVPDLCKRPSAIYSSQTASMIGYEAGSQTYRYSTSLQSHSRTDPHPSFPSSFPDHLPPAPSPLLALVADEIWHDST